MKYDELGAFLLQGPLYMPRPVDDAKINQLGPAQSPAFYMLLPSLIDHHCARCGAPTRWALSGGSYQGGLLQGVHEITFKCRNCGDAQIALWLEFTYSGGRAVIEKIGQRPKLEVTIPKDIETALGQQRVLYVRGLTARHQGYGIGALPYLRRVVEETTDTMLELLEAAMLEIKASQEAIDTLRKARASRRFEEKVKVAAEVIPDALRPGGANPFADLYEIVSIGLHNENDEECCEIVDEIDESLRWIFKQLKSHVADQRSYRDAVKKIQAKRSELKGKERGDTE